MVRWLADENLNNNIFRGLFRENRDIDIIRAQDAGTDDEKLLAWAAEQDRVLLTHDVSTITAHAYRRVMKGYPMPGVFEVSRGVSVRTAVDDILLLTECSGPGGEPRFRADSASNCRPARVKWRSQAALPFPIRAHHRRRRQFSVLA